MNHVTTESGSVKGRHHARKPATKKNPVKSGTAENQADVRTVRPVVSHAVTSVDGRPARAVQLRGIGGQVAAIREMVELASRDLVTAQVANRAADVELQGGAAKELVELAAKAIMDLQDCLSWIAYSGEIIASEIGMKLDPGETDPHLDCLEFTEKRSGVSYGDELEASDQAAE